MKRKTKTQQTNGARKTLEGSRDAKRMAAVVLEVLSGLRDARSGSEAMGVSVNRYYQLETRAIQGLIAALEPRPKGRRLSTEDQLATAERERSRLAQELARHQALLRSAQRSLGIASATKESKRGKLAGKSGQDDAKRKRRRTVARGLRTVAALRASAAREAADATSTTTGPTSGSGSTGS